MPEGFLLESTVRALAPQEAQTALSPLGRTFPAQAPAPAKRRSEFFLLRPIYPVPAPGGRERSPLLGARLSGLSSSGATGVLSFGVGLSWSGLHGDRSFFLRGGAQFRLRRSRDSRQRFGFRLFAGTISGSPRVPSGILSTGPDKGASCAFKGMVLSVSFEGCASNKGGAVGGILFPITSFFGGRATIRSSGATGAASGKTLSLGSGGAGGGSSALGFFRNCPRSSFSDCMIEGQSRKLRGYRSFLLVGLFRSTFLGWLCRLRLRCGRFVRLRRRRLWLRRLPSKDLIHFDFGERHLVTGLAKRSVGLIMIFCVGCRRA